MQRDKNEQIQDLSNEVNDEIGKFKNTKFLIAEFIKLHNYRIFMNFSGRLYKNFKAKCNQLHKAFPFEESRNLKLFMHKNCNTIN
jgi:hypothetical protein